MLTSKITTRLALPLAAILQLAPFCGPSAATVENPFTVRTPEWAADESSKVPLTVIHRDSGTTLWNGAAPPSLDMRPGRYLVKVSHVYGSGAKRLRYTGFFRLTEKDLLQSGFSHLVETLGERSLGGQWLDDAAYEAKQLAMLAKQERIRRTRQLASELAEDVLRTMETGGAAAAFADASRLHSQYGDHEITHSTLATFNAQVCATAISKLTSTRYLDAARKTLDMHRGTADCVRDAENLFGEVADIVAIENSAATKVQSGDYVQAYALLGQIKRDFSHLVEPTSLNSNLKELLRPLSGEKSHKPRLVRLSLQL